jgi:hypothetical protein
MIRKAESVGGAVLISANGRSFLFYTTRTIVPHTSICITQRLILLVLVLQRLDYSARSTSTSPVTV